MNELAVTLTVEQLRELVRAECERAAANASVKPPSEVMTLEQCAELLHRHPKIVMKMTRESGLPVHFISDREPRFRRSEVLEWLNSRPTEAKKKTS